MSLKEELKTRALGIGFDLVGVAPANPGRDLEVARNWAERGFGGEMRYLANPKRFEPQEVLPGVKSVICVGLIYDTPFPYSEEVRSQFSGAMTQKSEAPRFEVHKPSPSGRRWSAEGGAGEGSDFRFSNFEFPSTRAAGPRAWISRYAWGRDYHEIMREKLERLRAAIDELAPGTETRVFVDTGPVSERAFARFSGLGWMGKNTMIINEGKGSWFFLGVILTNLMLDPDLPAPDRCGSCTACLDACPTGALFEPYVMDARRCISYLTIELKGPIPANLRPRMGDHIFGCDICQDVCPWNGKSRIQGSGSRSQEKDFEPIKVGSWQSAVDSEPIPNPKSRIENPPDTFSLFAPPLDALASMSEEQFREAFRRSPIKRAKFRGWLRNLCVAMGNSGDARVIPRLTELASHADPIIREHAVWALGRIRNSHES